jgi:hypothetical protein
MIEAIASFMKISPRLATRVANRADPVDHGTPGALRAVSDTSTMQEPVWFVEDMGRNGQARRSGAAYGRWRDVHAPASGRRYGAAFTAGFK